MSESNHLDDAYYNFPPFFTLQPNLDTRKKQIQTWIKYILDYCKKNSVSEIVIDSFPLFENNTIGRSLDITMRQLLMEQLCQDGYSHCEREGVYSMVEKSVKDWAYTIYNWMIDNGYRMEVMDLEEIRVGDRVCHESFYDMKESLFKDCMEILKKDGKLQYITNDSVRFL